MNRHIVIPLLAAAAVVCQGVFAEDELDTFTAGYQSVERERVLDGVIEAVNRSTVSAQVSARVIAIDFDVDDSVEKGALIVEFDDTEYQARLREAIASREAAQSSLEAAGAHFERIKNLFARQTASKADFDQARADLGTAQAQLEAAEAVIARIRQQLDYTKVRAPYSGIVTERHIEVGETANPGTPLMSGFSLEQLRVVVNVPQRLIGAVEEYRKARVLTPDGAQTDVTGEHITVFPYALQSTGTIPVRVRLPDNTPGVYPGMLVKVAFSIGNRLRLAIPAAALVYRSEVVGVYVIDGSGKPSFRHVRVGNTATDGTVEILSGLDDGERVALDPPLAAARLKQRSARID